MSKFLIIIVICFSYLFSFGQIKGDYVWLTGEDNNLVDTTFGGSEFSFNESPPVWKYFYREMDFQWTNASICNDEGELLFYTNGCWIANADHVEMVNGDGINPGIIHADNCAISGYRMADGAMILKQPESDSLYYLFHKRQDYVFEPVGKIVTDGLRYTLVDLSKQGGLGEVLVKNELAVEDTVFYGEVEAVRHANNRDWWLLTTIPDSNLYYRILLTPEGIDGPWTQVIGTHSPKWDEGGNQAVFSPDGLKYACFGQERQVHYYSFDRETGLLGQFQRLIFADTLASLGGGIAFSPNSRFLYISNFTKVWQFDTEADNVQDSRVTVAEWDGYEEEVIPGILFSPSYFYLMQLGPDCRIYINSTGEHRLWHVINYPDEKGSACDLQQHSLRLSTWNYGCMPNFPNYRLGTGLPVCDSSLHTVAVGNVQLFRPKRPGLKVFPNPATSEVTFQLSGDSHREVQLTIYDQMGRRILEKAWPSYQLKYSIQLSSWPTGLYYYVLLDPATGWKKEGRLVVQR